MVWVILNMGMVALCFGGIEIVREKRNVLSQ